MIKRISVFLAVCMVFWGNGWAKEGNWSVIASALKLYNSGHLIEAAKMFETVKTKEGVSEKYLAFAEYGIAASLDKYFSITNPYEKGPFADSASVERSNMSADQAGAYIDSLLGRAKSLSTDATLNGSMKIGEWDKYKKMFHSQEAGDNFQKLQQATKAPTPETTPQ